MNYLTSVVVIAILAVGLALALRMPVHEKTQTPNENIAEFDLRESSKLSDNSDVVLDGPNTAEQVALAEPLHLPTPFEFSGEIESSKTETFAITTDGISQSRLLPPIQVPNQSLRRLPLIQTESKRLPPIREEPRREKSRPARQRERTDFTVHRISDGDDLKSLAAKHLGNQQRYLELFELNRDRLSRPDILPIGVQIRIPFPAN